MSDARVELGTALGTWLEPVLGAIAGAFITNVLDARSKKFTPAASDLESSNSDRISHSLVDMATTIRSMGQRLERMQASQDVQQQRINCLIANGGNLPNTACQASYPARQCDEET